MKQTIVITDRYLASATQTLNYASKLLFTLPKYVSGSILLVAMLLVSSCSDNDSASTATSIEASLTAPAELVSLQQITIGPPNIRRMWQFKIEYLAKENALVKEGDVLIRFDGQRLQDDLISRRSQLDSSIKEAEKQVILDEAKKQNLILDVAEAKKNLEIAKRKVEITDVSRSKIERQKQQAEFEIAQETFRQNQQKLAQHEVAIDINNQVQQAKISNRQVRLEQIEHSIERLSVKAPADGLVLYIEDWSDGKPTVGDTVFMGRTLMQLPSLDRIAVKAEFDESDTEKVFVGQAVEVTLDAYPQNVFNGIISEIGKAYRPKSQSNLKIVFDASIELESLDLNIMRPGMKANVTLAPEERLASR